MNSSNDIEVINQLVTKLNKNILEGKWKFEMLYDYENNERDKCKSAVAELIKPKNNKTIEEPPSTNIFIEIKTYEYQYHQRPQQGYYIRYTVNGDDRLIISGNYDEKTPKSSDVYKIYNLISSVIDE